MKKTFNIAFGWFLILPLLGIFILFYPDSKKEINRFYFIGSIYWVIVLINAFFI